MNSFATPSDPDAAAAEQPRGAFFRFDGEAWTPAEPSRSPWNPNATNGVAVGGLLMHIAEQVEAPCPMVPAHVTIDILRPVPFAPTHTRAEVTRPGRKMQMVESFLLAGGEPVARARVLRVREAPSPHLPAPNAYPTPQDSGSTAFLKPSIGLSALIETRELVAATPEAPRGAIWARFVSDLAPGVPLTPMVRAAMMADFGNGISRVVAREGWSFANVDISLHLVRRPVGEWILLEAEGMVQGVGVGLSNMALGDCEGQFGRAHQALFIDRIG